MVTIAATTWVDAWTHLLEDTIRGQDPLSLIADTVEIVAKAATEEASQQARLYTETRHKRKLGENLRQMTNDLRGIAARASNFSNARRSLRRPFIQITQH